MEFQEQGGESPKTLPTVEELNKLSADLARKVQEAKKQKEKDIHQKITDRETLIGQIAKNEELLQEARKTLTFYQQLDEAGELPEEEKNKAEEMRNLISQLENEQETLDQKIAAISYQPEIEEKLHDTANQENINRLKEEVKEKFEQKFVPQLENLATMINKKWEELLNKKKIAEKKQEEAKDEIEKLLKEADEIVENKFIFQYLLKDAWSELANRDNQKFKMLIEKKRRSLGIFSSKKKQALDHLLDNWQKFEQFVQCKNEVEPAYKQIWDDGIHSEMRDEFKNQLTGIAKDMVQELKKYPQFLNYIQPYGLLHKTGLVSVNRTIHFFNEDDFKEIGNILESVQ